jgi:hypothetical protein
MKKVIVLFYSLILIAAQSIAQMSFVAKVDNNIVSLDDQVRLIFTLNNMPGEISAFNPPDLTEFDVVGPFESSSTVSINGRTQSSYELTYILSPHRLGKFTIKPAEASINGKKYNSNSVSLEVTKGNTNRVNNNLNNNDITDVDIFLAVIPDKASLYVGEPLVLTVKLYSKFSINDLNNFKGPSIQGGWSEAIATPNPDRLISENLNGVQYGTAVLQRLLIFPQNSGEIRINPAELNVGVVQTIKRRVGGYIMQDQQVSQKKLKSVTKSISVLALPSNKPADFSGAVGTFNFSAKFDKTTGKTGEALKLTLSLTGTGNFKLIEPIDCKLPTSDFNVWPPETTDNITNTVNGANGSRTFQYLIIPKNPGNFTISPITFSYFDLGSRQYKKLSSPEFKLHIDKGSGEESSGVVSGLTKEDLKYIGTDIHFIKNYPFSLRNKGENFYYSFTFYCLFILAITVFIVVLVVRRKHLKDNANLAMIRNRKASKVSRKRLKTANIYLKENNKIAFYTEVSRALWGYMSDKLGIPVSQLSRENVIENVSRYLVDNATTAKFIEVLDLCEFAQYAPPSEATEMGNIYQSASDIINIMEQKLS